MLHPIHLILFALTSIVLSSCASHLVPNKSLSSSVSPSAQERLIAERIYKLINDERREAERKPLQPHSGLNRLAQAHSAHMVPLLAAEADGFYLLLQEGVANHYGSENRAQYAYLKYSIENLSEMTYSAYAESLDPAMEAVESWMSSPEHRNHMLQSWDVTGIGVESSEDGETYITICMGAQPMGTPRGIRPIGW